MTQIYPNALIEQGIPVFGVVLAPALGDLYLTLTPERAAYANAGGSKLCDAIEKLEFQDITTRATPREGLTVVGSRSHKTEQDKAWLNALPLPVRSHTCKGSSLKICLVAAGKADIYPRFGPTMEWDTAAGHAVLNAAGGLILNTDGTPFIYKKTDQSFKNPGFIAYASKELREAVS